MSRMYRFAKIVGYFEVGDKHIDIRTLHQYSTGWLADTESLKNLRKPENGVSGLENLKNPENGHKIKDLENEKIPPSQKCQIDIIH